MNKLYFKDTLLQLRFVPFFRNFSVQFSSICQIIMQFGWNIYIICQHLDGNYKKELFITWLVTQQ